MSSTDAATAPPGGPPSDPRHYGYIDALRGWAALGVICVHSAYSVGGQDALGVVLGQLAGFGKYGVPLFFVVSALTLCLSAEARRGRDRRPLPAFFARRLFRIAPLYWCGAVYYLAGADFGPHFYAPDGVSATTVALTVVFANGWRPDQINAAIPGGWSIAVEMGFYLLFPAMFRVASTPARAACLFAACLAVAFATVRLPARLFPDTPPELLAEFRYFWLPSQLPVFAAGILAYHLIRRPVADAWPVAFVFAATLVLARTRLVSETAQFAVAFVLLTWGLSLRPTVLLVNRFTQTVGVLSFSVYLVHFVLWGLVREALALDTGPEHPVTHSTIGRWLGFPLADLSHWPPAARFVILFTGTTCLSLPVAAVTHLLIERPGIAAGKWLIRRLGW